MLPNHVASSVPLPAAFLSPKTQDKDDLSDICWGGAALGDASAGLQVQDWAVSLLDSDSVVYTPQLTGTPTTVLTVTTGHPVVWLAGAFDQSMRVAIAYVSQGLGYFYYFDTLSNAYVTIALPLGAVRPFVTLDDVRSAALNSSDIIVSYLNTLTGHLYFRAQRDRFGVEYDLGAVPPGLALVQVGMNAALRLQFHFELLAGGGRTIWRPRSNATVN